RAQFFKQVEAREAPSADKAIGLLRLIERRMLPEGECEMRAKMLAVAFMKRGDFAATLCPDNLPPKDHQPRKDELKMLLQAAGRRPKEEEELPSPAAESAA